MTVKSEPYADCISAFAASTGCACRWRFTSIRSWSSLIVLLPVFTHRPGMSAWTKHATRADQHAAAEAAGHIEVFPIALADRFRVVQEQLVDHGRGSGSAFFPMTP